MMKKYSTSQREVLESFLRDNRDRQFSINEIAEKLCGDSISVSAVYRNINKLVNDGVVKQYAEENKRKFLYQYIGDTECNDHLHMKCVKCGQISHLDAASMAVIMNSVSDNTSFKLDKQKTILYGSCDSCEKI